MGSCLPPSQDRRMSYYRYITGVYKSYLPELNRTLRSSSVPRTVLPLDTSRYVRSSSVPPSYFDPNFCRPSTPFNDRAKRAVSVPPPRFYRTTVLPSPEGHFSDFDCKVIDYQSRLDREFNTRSYISQTRTERERAFESQAEARESYHRQYPEGSFSSKYNYYDGNKYESNYLYNTNSDLLGQWKHYNLSADTLNYRNQRAKSPLQTREINRYFESKKRSNYVGDMSSGGGMDFRHYNYRKVPYFGGSDGYQYMMNYKLQNGQRRGL